jgi:hypothetical protein
MKYNTISYKLKVLSKINVGTIISLFKHSEDIIVLCVV